MAKLWPTFISWHFTLRESFLSFPLTYSCFYSSIHLQILTLVSVFYSITCRYLFCYLNCPWFELWDPLKLPLVFFDMFGSFLDQSLPYFMAQQGDPIYSSTSQLQFWKQPFLQRALAPFVKEWNLEYRIWD